MDKLKFLRLWDLYHALLTPHQQEITDLYFNFDLTLSEIAESKGISRQGVSDCLQGCKKQLAEWEEKLHFSAMLQEGDLATSFMVTDIRRAVANFLGNHPEFSVEMNEILSFTDKDYTQEVKASLNKE
jgi:hypothetical protein